ncbi:hypothetical protein BC832DRAFT_594651 [Gaertneriomyces semiglobifer]|nr:hypothetical protein BC832DRAFT_594651 [Gaertneriomyces semiglobifer]
MTREDSPNAGDAMDIDDIHQGTSSTYDDEDESINLEYQPPKDFIPEKLSLTSVFDWDSVNEDESKELWIMRVPAEIQLTQLNALAIRNPKSTKPSHPLTTITTSQDTYGIYDLTSQTSDAMSPLGDIAEMQNLQFVLPSRRSKKYRFTLKKAARILSVAPVSAGGPDALALREAGESVLHTPESKMVHPEGMHLQSLPYGFTTTGSGLQASLARYDLNETSTVIPNTPPTKKAGKSKEKSEKSSAKKKRKSSDAGLLGAEVPSSNTEEPSKKKKKRRESKVKEERS